MAVPISRRRPQRRVNTKKMVKLVLLSLGFVTLFMGLVFLMTRNQGAVNSTYGAGYEKAYEAHGFKNLEGSKNTYRSSEFTESDDYKIKGKRFSSY